MITEINYNVDPKNAGGEFIEITNNGTAAVDIGDWVVDQAVCFVFPAGTSLGPGQSLILANDAQAASSFYEVPIFGEYTRSLSNAGATVILKTAALTVIDVVTYGDASPWPTEADGGGASLELINLDLDNNDFRNWGLGHPYSPGKTNSPVSGGAVGDVAISEIMYKPRRSEEREKFDRVNQGRYTEEGDDEAGEYVEIVNVTKRAINLAGWTLTDAIDYTFGDVSIAPGEMLLIAADPGVMKDRTGKTALGPFSGSLDDGGARLTLRDGSGALVDTVRYNDNPPWPTSPDQFGFSLEVIDPSEDNSTAANWRASRASFSGGVGSRGVPVFVEHGDTWRYQKGTSPYPSGWTTVGFRDAGWLRGRTGIGYGDGDDDTVLADMRDGYHSFAARKTFRVSQSQYEKIGRLTLEVDYDDAFVAYLNGVEVARSSLLAGAGSPVPYNRTVEPPGHEAGVFESFSFSRSRLRRGRGASGNNVLAIQLNNRPRSSDASMSARLLGTGRRSSGGGALRNLVGGGTPGAQNSTNAVGLPPFVANLEHSPLQPTSSQSVQITASIESASPLKSVQILYSTDTSTSINTVTMFDDGAHGDGAAGDGSWGGRIPAHPSPTFVNYRVRATDSSERTTVYPYEGEPSETQAYLSFDNDISTTLPIYHLYITPRDESRLAARPYDDHYVNAHLAIDGVAHPNIDVRLRGRGSRLNPKRQWKFRFNRHQLYKGNRTLDTMMNRPFIQWFSFEMFDRAGIANLSHDLIRVYKNGSFFGVSIMFESPNSSWVRKEGLPPSTEVYKARSLETPGRSKNSDLYTNQLKTDWDFWGAWNKKLRPLEKPTHIRELTFNLNNMSDQELLPWLEQNVNLDAWFTRWILHLLLASKDFNGHNYYAIRPGDDGTGNRGRWTIVGYDYDAFGPGPLPAFFGDGNSSFAEPDQRNKLYQRVSRNRTLRRIWALKLRQILNDYWNLSEIFAFIDHNFRRLSPDRRLDVGRWGHYWAGSTSGVKSILSNQRSLLHSWLNRQSLPPASRTPAISPAGGELSGPVNVSISVSSGWTGYYTVDGSDPRLSTTHRLYTAPFVVKEPTTVRVAAISGRLESGEWTDLAETTFGNPTNVTPVIRVRGAATDDPSAINRRPVRRPVVPAPNRATDDTPVENVPPVAQSKRVRTRRNAPVRIRLTYADPGGPGPYRFTVNSPRNGRLLGRPPVVSYRPNRGFVGRDSFTYSVNDGIAESRAATVTIMVRSLKPPSTDR